LTAWNKGLTKETDKRILEHSLGMSGKNNYNYGRQFSFETIQKLRLANLGKKASLESRRKMSLARKGHKFSPEWVAHIRESKLGSKNPNYGKHPSLETIAKMRFSHTGKKQSEQTRLKHKLSYEKNRISIMTKCIKAKLKRPTSLEQKMIDVAKFQELPLEYVGDGSVIVNGANPDFICTDGRKLLLEVAGRYWHSDSYERQRCAIFSKFGFKVLVIWEEEFKDEVRLVSRIKDFLGVRVE
jgi:hypothetical protein